MGFILGFLAVMMLLLIIGLFLVFNGVFGFAIAVGLMLLLISPIILLIKIISSIVKGCSRKKK